MGGRGGGGGWGGGGGCCGAKGPVVLEAGSTGVGAVAIAVAGYAKW